MKSSFFKRFLKWTAFLSLLYLSITTIILGYEDVDERKGVYNFYWSGLKALWNTSDPFGIIINKPIRTNFKGKDGPYVIGDKVYTVDDVNKLYCKKNDGEVNVAFTINTSKSFKVRLKDSITQEKI